MEDNNTVYTLEQLVDGYRRAKLYRKAYRYQRAAWRLAARWWLDGWTPKFNARGKVYAERAAELFKQAEEM